MKKIIFWTILGIILLGVVGFTYVYKKIVQDIPVPPLTEITSIEDIVEPYIANEMTKGLSIGTYRDGEIQFYNYGIKSDKELETPTQESIYEIGSITKTFTGTVLAALVKEGKVRYDDPIAKFLPDSVANWSADKAITFEELSTHTSGLPRLPNNLMKNFFIDMDNPYRNYAAADMYDFLSKYEPKEKAARKSEYSNLGVGLLGHLLAEINGTSYEEMIQNHIFQPLGMSQSTITIEEELLMQGHDAVGVPTSQWDFIALAGAGAIRSSTTDMMKYLVANIEEQMPYVLTHEPRKEMSDFQKIGLGWISQKNKKLAFTWHNGGTGGFTSFTGFSKADQVGVIVLANSVQSVDGIGVRILEFLAKSEE